MIAFYSAIRHPLWTINQQCSYISHKYKYAKRILFAYGVDFNGYNAHNHLTGLIPMKITKRWASWAFIQVTLSGSFVLKVGNAECMYCIKLMDDSVIQA